VLQGFARAWFINKDKHMKKIKLTAYSTPKKTAYVKNNSYSVYLGNNTFENFSNLKDCKKYLADASRFLNYKMFEINTLLVECNAAYRSVYFQFYDSAGGNYLKLESEIIERLESAARFLDYSWQKSGLTNGNFFAFDFLHKAARALGKCLELLKNLARTKNKMDLVQHFEVLRQRCLLVDYTLEIYPGEVQQTDKIDYSFMKIA